MDEVLELRQAYREKDDYNRELQQANREKDEALKLQSEVFHARVVLMMMFSDRWDSCGRMVAYLKLK